MDLLDHTSNIIRASSIDCLNDDCLVQIFQYLSIKEKLKVESVCNNWNRVVKMSWSSIKWITVERILPYKSEGEIDLAFKKKNETYLINLSKRCGIFLHNLKIDTHLAVKCLSVNAINKIPQYFTNLTDINIMDNNDPRVFTDESLQVLFANNPNISNLQLAGLSVNGNCLLKLDKNRIKELHLEYCRFNSSGYFYAFLGNLRNLKKLKICDTIDEVVKIIDSLIMSEYKNILEVDIKLLHEISFIPNLSSFLSNQDKICKLKLYNVLINQEFLDNLPTESLEELNIKFLLRHNELLPPESSLNISKFLSKQKEIHKVELCNLPLIENFYYSPNSFLEELNVEFSYRDSENLIKNNNLNLSILLSRQQNIRKLKLVAVVLNENLLKALPTECLEELNLNFEEDLQSGEIVSKLSSHLSKQPKLRFLKMRCIEIDENLIQNLPAKTLEELNLECVNEDSNIDLRCLKHLENLKTFGINFRLLNDDYLEAIAESINENIKSISITFNDYSSSTKKIPNFSRLKNLESFALRDEGCDPDDEVDVDNILENLSQLKNLKYLEIDDCNFSTAGLTSISRLPNLTELKISSADNNEEDFLDFIDKSTSIRELRIYFSTKITNNLIKKANEIKVRRGDSNTLKFYFLDCDLINYNDFKYFPLVDVEYHFSCI